MSGFGSAVQSELHWKAIINVMQGLSIRRCQKVTDLAVAAVASNGRLQRLIVNNVPNIGKLTLAALQAHCR